MKLQYYFFICTVFILFSCRERNADHYTNPPTPSQVIEKEKFTKILYELHLTEAKLAHSAWPPDTAAMVFRLFRDSIFTMFDTDSAVFFENLDYYNRKPKTMYQIYISITDSLTVLQSKFEIHQGDRNNPNIQSETSSGENASGKSGMGETN